MTSRIRLQTPVCLNAMETMKSIVDIEATCHSVLHLLSYPALKPEQLSVQRSFVDEKDALDVLQEGASMTPAIQPLYLTECEAVTDL